MLRIGLIVILVIANTCLAAQKNVEAATKPVLDRQARALAAVSNVSHMEELLDNICIVRAVGTPGHDTVKNYIIQTMSDLGWTVETDKFPSTTPIGQQEFENVVVKMNPNASKYLAMACHYDSKYMEGFVGAIDSAVPCSQLINLATVMKPVLESLKNANHSLMFIFFDGEEAFVDWSNTDSIYGARHLAAKWERTFRDVGDGAMISDLQRIEVLMLLDLLGAPHPEFYNYFEATYGWYNELVNAENQLEDLSLLHVTKGNRTYFHPASKRSYVADDHLPFYHRNVPVLHLIPNDFPSVWHELSDNRANIDLNTTENLNKILRVFVARYFSLNVQ